MVVPMVLHLIGVLAIGLFPIIGIKIIEAPAAMLLGLSTAPNVGIMEYVPVTLMSSLTFGSMIFLGILAAVLLLRFALLPRCERKHVTWGCGYTAPNTRMQYTGASFSGPMVAVFKDFLQFVTRKKLPKGVFPENGFYESNCVDAVESKIFSVLGEGERMSIQMMSRLPESSSFSFLVGLITLLIMVVLLSTR
jgi:hydrogenase-4 component B